jgi:predicted nuclease of predicted toxin-antitoxin system
MIQIYIDVNVPLGITNGLRLRGIDVLTAQEDGFRRKADPLVLDRCTELHRILFTRDRDFIGIVNAMFLEGRPFAGVFFAYSKTTPYARLIDDLALIAEATEWKEWLNRLEIIPL